MITTRTATTTIATVVWICLALTSYTTKFWIPAWRNGREGNKNGNVSAIEFGFPPSLQATKLCRCCVNIVVVVFLRLSTVNGFQLPPSCMLEYPRVPVSPLRLHSFKSFIGLSQPDSEFASRSLLERWLICQFAVEQFVLFFSRYAKSDTPLSPEVATIFPFPYAVQ